jgi:hypothetical protein
MITIEMTESEAHLFNGYLQAIDFTESGRTASITVPLSTTYFPEAKTKYQKGGAQLTDEFFRKSVIDCLSFYSAVKGDVYPKDLERAGRDFWLTRNFYATGLWDTDVRHEFVREKLQKIAHSYGSVTPYFKEEE